MKIIAHRGNIEGAGLKDRENSPLYIIEALTCGYDVEVDVWCVGGRFFLGHDHPDHEVRKDFLFMDKLWLHAKSIQALWELKNVTNCFFHDKDDAVLTSRNYIWVFPGKPLVPGCVAQMRDDINYSKDELKRCHAICSDTAYYYKKKFVND